MFFSMKFPVKRVIKKLSTIILKFLTKKIPIITMNKIKFNLSSKFQNYPRKFVNSSFDWKFHTEKH